MDLSLPTVMSVCDTIDALQGERVAMDPNHLAAKVRAVYAQQGVPLSEGLLRQAVALHCEPAPCEPVVPINAAAVLVEQLFVPPEITDSAETETETSMITYLDTCEDDSIFFERKAESKLVSLLDWFSTWWALLPLATLGIIFFGCIFQTIKGRQDFVEQAIPALVNEAGSQSTVHALALVKSEPWRDHSNIGNLTVRDSVGRPSIRWAKVGPKVCQTMINEALTHPDHFTRVDLSIDGRPMTDALDLQDFYCDQGRFDIVINPRVP